ncbi:hypothetical protein FE257_004471 [Aspergillus nanangensis]|uniref:CFEM domain-containing protein n=1 Tax=Aspergillus nanangensis TaxID=2582783 RepID=A0AAD4GZK3_ASPNN|nr:hypothetical protein FE257_004471 [Aspergillus nanangensis]
MQLHRASLLGILGLLVVGVVGSDADSPNPELPQCAVTCQSQTLNNNSTLCASTDTSCLCADNVFQTTLTECVTADCTGREALVAKRASSRQCHVPYHKGHPEVEAATLVPLILATLLFLIRMTAKAIGLGGGWGPDDYTIIVAEILAIILFALNASMIHHGFGSNIWDIVPMEDITALYKRFYGFVILYKAQISLAKISVCLFLLRIFQSRAFRYVTYIIIGLNAAIAFTWILTDSLRCMPPRLAWTGWAGEEPGKCIDFMTATFANAFVNIAVDTVMVLMPVYEILKLNLNARKKAGVGIMFAMGLVLTVVAILRVVVFWFNRWGSNPTVELQPIVHWSVIEVQIAVLCACLPTTRAMFVHLFPGVIGESAGTSYPQPTTPSGRGMFPNGRSTGGQKSAIAKTVSYSVDYGSKPQHGDEDSFVRLVEMEPASVGHDESSLTEERTLESLYINPILDVLKRQNPQSPFVKEPTNNGVFDTDTSQTLYFFIDCKTSGRETFKAVIAALQPLRDQGYLTTLKNNKTIKYGPITVIGTGNTPLEMVTSVADRDYFFDAQLDTLTDAENVGITNLTSPIASTSFGSSIGAVTLGDNDSALTDDQLDTLRSQISAAKSRGIGARYWETPYYPIRTRNAVWRTLLQEGVTLVNADDLDAVAGYF